MTKVQSHAVLVLHNVRMEQLDMRKKTVTKVLSNVILEPHNVRIEPSNTKKK